MTLGTGDYLTAGNAIDPRPILIVTGLVQEARIAAGPGMAVICSSSSPTQLRALLTVVDPETIRGVISFGVAGGLDPSLRSGDVVLATEVLDGDTRWAAGLSLGDELIDRLTSGRRRVVRGSLAGAEEVVTKRACKAALHSETGASAVDMESHIAAAYAAEAGLPFAAVRVISDPAHRALPALARAAIKPNGQIDLAAVLRGIVRNPATLHALVSTGIDFNRALRSLRGCRDYLIGTEIIESEALVSKAA
ncbi:phosphorylase [Bradyrhizobium sp. CIR48]|uniref:phosphorylase n=1 Tax=Bradyrhizobium sp. CIR48 TaxID=2663840 RepID=UPI0016060C2B|nr:phosphorylase [Bradyrhizobium sp. CIR48]